MSLQLRPSAVLNLLMAKLFSPEKSSFTRIDGFLPE
jgi:hypothetical protein